MVPELIPALGPTDKETLLARLELVDGLVERRVRVHVGAAPHPDPLEVVHDRLLRESPRAIERHVLDEVREPPLRVGLENRAGIHRQAQLGPLLRPPVSPNQVAEPVGKLPADDRGIRGEGGSEVGALRERGGGGGESEKESGPEHREG